MGFITCFIISVPLKRGELNINQIAPERGDNQVL